MDGTKTPEKGSAAETKRASAETKGAAAGLKLAGPRQVVLVGAAAWVPDRLSAASLLGSVALLLVALLLVALLLVALLLVALLLVALLLGPVLSRARQVMDHRGLSQRLVEPWRWTIATALGPVRVVAQRLSADWAGRGCRFVPLQPVVPGSAVGAEPPQLLGSVHGARAT